MGFGDPYHKHPLRFLFNIPKNDDGGVANCFHCELPIIESLPFVGCYGCTHCNYYIHMLCQDLPIILRHPLHDQHPLTHLEPPSSSNSPDLCNECNNPCLGRFAYHCVPCQVFFHLKCLLRLNNEKHDHPLTLSDEGSDNWTCKVFGHPNIGINFGCKSCKWRIHPECSLIPLRVNHHHIHELTLRHNFPQESEQVFCDLCEDKDGELDRALSYYYCKRCDYIAHVHCCITQPRKDTVLYESFTHKHPLRRVESNICCNQCDYVSGFLNTEYPSLIKHPSHPEHTLVVDREGDDAFNCTECQFTIERNEAILFTHPLLWRSDLKFYCRTSLFRCNACGELGKGSRVRCEYDGGFDLHLECFAFPGKLKHESHPHHPLYLRWLYNLSTSLYCSVCTKEIDQRLWFYFCQECNYATHMDCVVHELLSTIRASIKNQPDFCAIIEPDKTSFQYEIEDRRPRPSSNNYRAFEPPLLKISNDDGDNEIKCDLGIEAVDGGLCCPKCNLLIPIEARYSTIKDWESSHSKNLCTHSFISANDQAPSTSGPLSFLDERKIDELYCSICNLFIFPPTYSCASCEIYFHKSCAELPHKILFDKTTYVLMARPFPEGFSDCSYCKHPIPSFAYLSSEGGFIFDVHCASGAPLVNQIYHKHPLSFMRKIIDFECKACKNLLERSTLIVGCKDGRCFNFKLHPECALLRPVIKHGVHQHPLELATDLAELYDEYICDVCEQDLNPNLWAYRCMDSCGMKATSHVTCVITSKKKCHFRYEDECQNMTEHQKLVFRQTEAGIREYGKYIGSL